MGKWCFGNACLPTLSGDSDGTAEEGWTSQPFFHGS